MKNDQMEEIKTHYKLHKKGKQWLVIGVASFAAIIGMVGMSSSAQADQAVVEPATAVQTVTTDPANKVDTDETETRADVPTTPINTVAKQADETAQTTTVETNATENNDDELVNASSPTKVAVTPASTTADTPVAAVEATPASDFEYAEVANQPDQRAITKYTGTATDVVIPSEVTIGGITSTITGIAQDAFLGNENITSVVIPDTVIWIGAGAFARTTNLTSVTLSNNLTLIRENAFLQSGLTNIVIPNSVTQIGAYAFAMNKLTSATISTGLTTLAEGVFYNNLLTSVAIPDGITTIDMGAFSTNKLTDITIPNSVTQIGTYAFSTNKLTNVTIPTGLITLAEGVFYDNLLTSVVIPAGVTDIGNGAFSTNKLTNISIPNGVTNIGAEAFAGNLLTMLTNLPTSLTTIGDLAFAGNNIDVAVLPSSLTTAGTGILMSNHLVKVETPIQLNGNTNQTGQFYGTPQTDRVDLLGPTLGGLFSLADLDLFGTPTVQIVANYNTQGASQAVTFDETNNQFVIPYTDVAPTAELGFAFSVLFKDAAGNITFQGLYHLAFSFLGVNDTTISTGDQWNSNDNFDYFYIISPQLDANGNPATTVINGQTVLASLIPFDYTPYVTSGLLKLNNTNDVNTSKAGVYHVTYSLQMPGTPYTYTNTATVTVVDTVLSGTQHYEVTTTAANLAATKAKLEAIKAVNEAKGIATTIKINIVPDDAPYQVEHKVSNGTQHYEVTTTEANLAATQGKLLTIKAANEAKGIATTIKINIVPDEAPSVKHELGDGTKHYEITTNESNAEVARQELLAIKAENEANGIATSIKLNIVPDEAPNVVEQPDTPTTPGNPGTTTQPDEQKPTNIADQTDDLVPVTVDQTKANSVSVATTTKGKAKTLPRTDEQSSAILGLLGSVLLSSVGVAALRRKEKNDA